MVLTESDLVAIELSMVEQFRSYLKDTPRRGKVFMRFLRSEFPDICGGFMKKARTAKAILNEISPENQARMLKASQREVESQLSRIITQLELQSDSMFGEQAWREASIPRFGDRLIELGKRLKSGKPPKWKQDQDAATRLCELTKAP